MYKIYFAICVTLCLTLKIGAQSGDISIKNGPTFDPKGTITGFIGQVDNVIYAQAHSLAFLKSKTIIIGIDANSMKQVFETEVKLPDFKELRVTLRYFLLLQNELIALGNCYDKEKDQHYLLALKLNEKGEPEDSYIQLDELNAEKRKQGSFNTDFNQETGRLVVVHHPAYDKYANEEFGFKVLDKNMEPVWEEEIALPYLDKYFSVGDVSVNDDDVLYAVCSFNEYTAAKEEKGKKQAKDEAEERGSKYSYRIISLSKKSGKLKDFELSLESGKKIMDVNYTIDPQGNLNVAGLYSDNKSKGDAVGVYYLKLNGETGEVISQNAQAFSRELVKEYLSNFVSDSKAGKKTDKGAGIDNLYVRQFIDREDGGLVINGEIYRSYSVCTTDPKTGRQSCSNHYVYGYIFVINISPTGEIQWISTIPKNQHTVNDEGFFSSYAYLVSGEDLYFFFNDNVKNYNPKKPPQKLYRMVGAKKSVTTVARVDASGKVTKEPSTVLAQSRKLLRPKVRSYFPVEDKLITLGKLKKQESVVEIKVN